MTWQQILALVAAILNAILPHIPTGLTTPKPADQKAIDELGKDLTATLAKVKAMKP